MLGSRIILFFIKVMSGMSRSYVRFDFTVRVTFRSLFLTFSEILGDIILQFCPVIMNVPTLIVWEFIEWLGQITSIRSVLVNIAMYPFEIGI